MVACQPSGFTLQGALELEIGRKVGFGQVLENIAVKPPPDQVVSDHPKNRAAGCSKTGLSKMGLLQPLRVAAQQVVQVLQELQAVDDNLGVGRPLDARVDAGQEGVPVELIMPELGVNNTLLDQGSQAPLLSGFGPEEIKLIDPIKYHTTNFGFRKIIQTHHIEDRYWVNSQK